MHNPGRLLDEAVQLGVQNSKQLKRSQEKIDEALTRLDQAKDGRLPSAKLSFQYLHALMLVKGYQHPRGDKGSDQAAI